MGVRLPYWAGSWFGVFPTWQGIGAQAFAVTVVLGSYVLSEQLRSRRRRHVLTVSAKAAASSPLGLAPAYEAKQREDRGSVAAGATSSLSD